MIKIRLEEKVDIKPISEINKLAFKGENEAKLVDSIRESDLFVPELSLVAVTDEVVGHILFSKVFIDTETGMIETIALAPMSVKPEYQNQGIGSALVKEGLKRCGELGFEHVVVLGHPNFYPKFGFAPASQKGIEAPFRVPDEVFMALELREDSLKEIKGKLKYPPSFDVVS